MQPRSPGAPRGSEGRTVGGRGRGSRETSRASPMGSIPFRRPPATAAASKVKAKQTFPRLLNGVNPAGIHTRAPPSLPLLIPFYLFDKIFLNMGFL